jgi:hypothetical protein
MTRLGKVTLWITSRQLLGWALSPVRKEASTASAAALSWRRISKLLTPKTNNKKPSIAVIIFVTGDPRQTHILDTTDFQEDSTT